MNGPSSARRVWLVRHGRAAASWGAAVDPDLDDTGRVQAAEVAEVLAALRPVVAVTSPLTRCRSTAAAFAERSGLGIEVVDTVAEIPSPPGLGLEGRAEWLAAAMAGSWSDLGSAFTEYRDGLVGYVRGCADRTVVFSHFVAINAVIGACLGDDRLVVRRLDHCSVTTVDVVADGLRLVDGGREAVTVIR